MRRVQGRPLPLGVTITEGGVNFSIAVEHGRSCELLLYKKGTTIPCESLPMEEDLMVGEVRSLMLLDMDISQYEYNYLIDDEVVMDPYVREVAGRHNWGKHGDIALHEVRGRFPDPSYDWEQDMPLNLEGCRVIAYSLHVRGFTKHSSSKVEHRGTFLGLIEKIPYLKELGINQIQCMPLYEFEECLSYTNYWGYGSGFYFAPKSAYAAGDDAVRELKDLVRECHKNGIEVVAEMPFTQDTSKQMIEECLRYYRITYHMDGFILNPDIAAMDTILRDPILKSTKILRHQLGFQNVMRRFLKGDEGMVGEVIFWLKHHSEQEGTYNYIANHNGFTLNDAVSYDGKHNEQNGEQNQDGPDYNYSWNCGAEGPSRKKAVISLRSGQMRNAFYLVLLAQGMPCILAGDEFANTQKGNNNVYCQDNATAWIDWSKKEKNQELWQFVHDLIELRKEQIVFRQKKELKGIDYTKCGVPDVSYHGEYAWQAPSAIASRQLGVYYSGAAMDTNDCFVAYNMHWIKHSFALPALKKGREWYLASTTETGVLKEAERVDNQREILLKPRTISVLIGK